MWKVVYVVTNEDEAEELEEKLSSEGFLIDIVSSGDNYQIKAPESEVDAVYRAIINNLR